MPDQNERRRTVRVPFREATTIAVGDRSWIGTSVDLSLGGMRFKADDPEGLPAPGTSVEALLPISAGQPMPAVFHVVHRQGVELGLALRAVSADGFAHLRDVVRWNTPPDAGAPATGS